MSSIQKIFGVNNYITLKLEDERTNIYVGGELFRQCKGLFILNPSRFSNQEEINSVDDAKDKMRLLEIELDYQFQKYSISPEEEFMGHCSNLQVWVEHGYDTRILHRNLAFPLLKKLSELGDHQAKRVFKEEVLKRFLEGNKNTALYLENRGYLDFLSQEEILSVVENDEERNAIINLNKKLNGKLKMSCLPSIGFSSYGISEGKVISLKLIAQELTNFPKEIEKLKSLQELDLHGNSLKKIPKWLGRLKSLKILDLSRNSIEEIQLDQSHLERLNLENNPLSLISIKADNLTKINLKNVDLTVLDLSACSLKRLEDLDVSNNRIHHIASSTFDILRNLKTLDLLNNHISEIPEGIVKLEHLEVLNLSWNDFEDPHTKQFDSSPLKDLRSLRRLIFINRRVDSH